MASLAALSRGVTRVVTLPAASYAVVWRPVSGLSSVRRRPSKSYVIAVRLPAASVTRCSSPMGE